MDTLENRVKQFSQDIQPLLKKYNLKMGAVPSCPILCKEVDTALEVLKNHGIQYKVGFQEG